MKNSKQVKFQPWVGKNYRAGFKGVRILILGESPYRQYGEAYSPYHDIDLIAGQADPNDRNTKPEKTKPYALWTKILKLLSSNQADCRNEHMRHTFWHSVAFYNYIQEFVGSRARERPTEEMWNDAEKPFFMILTKLKPDFILVLGKSLWDGMPNKNSSDDSGSSCKYIVNGHPAIALRINHPSSFGFRYSKWKPRVSRGLRIAMKQKSTR